ncbi:MAG: hypothetical protein AAGG46_08435, partial [Planctomycetota bacterium]
MPAPLQHHLEAVRRRVRSALATELLGRLLAGAAALFWVGLAADRWLEPPPAVRQIAWGVVAVCAFAWLARACLVPLCRPLPDGVVARWIERWRPALQESLATSIEPRGDDSPEQRRLVDAAARHAAAVLAAEDPTQLVRFDRPRRWLASAAVGLATVGCFAAMEPGLFGFYLNRLALAPDAWPRRVALSIDGFHAEPDGRVVRRAALGSEIDLIIRADLTEGHIAPLNVEMRSRSGDGVVTEAVFAAVGSPTTGDDAHQRYRLKIPRVEPEARLTIRGGDARLGPLVLIGERRPQIIAVELEIAPPEYLEQPSSRFALGAVDTVPEGSRVTVHARASKPLSAVEVNRQTDDDSPPAPLV